MSTGMRPRTIMTALGAVGIAWAALDWVQFSRADDAEKARTAAELRELRSETRRLQAALASVEQRAQPLPSQAGGPKPAVPPEILAELAALKAKVAAVQPSDALPDPAEERHQELAFADYLDDQLARSPAGPQDPTPSLKTKLEDVLEADASLLDVRCGKELCRAKTRHKNSDAYRGFQARGFRQDTRRVWNGPVSFIVLEGRGDLLDQPMVVATYFGRGERLPSPDPPR